MFCALPLLLMPVRVTTSLKTIRGWLAPFCAHRSRLYDGNTTDAFLFAIVSGSLFDGNSGSSEAPQSVFYASGRSATVVFSSDVEKNEEGFEAQYRLVSCADTGCSGAFQLGGFFFYFLFLVFYLFGSIVDCVLALSRCPTCCNVCNPSLQ